MKAVKAGAPLRASSQALYAGCPTRWPSACYASSAIARARDGSSRAAARSCMNGGDRRPLGDATPAGGRTASPTAPTPSTWSRSCRWPPSALAGARPVLDVGTRRGPGRPARPRPRARAASSASTRPRRRSSRRTGAAGDRPTPAAGAAALPVRRTARFDAVVACLVFEHIDDVDEAIAEVARVLAPGGRFAFFLNHPLLQTPNSGWIDDQVLDPPEQYWRIGPTWSRTRRSRRWRRTCSSRSSTARSAAT